jgi:predicted acetyltransferase
MMAGFPENAKSRVRLVERTIEFEASHRSFVDEMRSTDGELIPWVLAWPNEAFADYVAKLRAAARGLGIGAGKVPHVTYWLLEMNANGPAEIVAVANIRFRLNDTLLRHGGHVGYGVRPSARLRGFATTILRMALGELRMNGVSRALLTCAETNIASAKTIVRNGGVLSETEFISELGCTVAVTGLISPLGLEPTVETRRPVAEIAAKRKPAVADPSAGEPTAIGPCASPRAACDWGECGTQSPAAGRWSR